MVCLTNPVGHIGAFVRMPWVAMTETDIKYVYPKREFAISCYTEKRRWGCPQGRLDQNWEYKDCLSISLPQVLGSLVQLHSLSLQMAP